MQLSLFAIFPALRDSCYLFWSEAANIITMHLTDNEKRDIVKYIETGVIKKPSVYSEPVEPMFVVAMVAKALDISVDDLLN